MKELVIETIRIIPSLLWLGFLLFFIIRYGDQMFIIITKISKVKLPWFEVEFIREELKKASEKTKPRNLPTRGEQISLLKRAEFVKANKVVLNALWIDDFPSNNISESRILEEIGLKITFVPSSEEALILIQTNRYDLILSDIDRNGDKLQGISFLKTLVEVHRFDIPTIFYTSENKQIEGVPIHAFAIASRPIELIHYCLDIMERNTK